MAVSLPVDGQTITHLSIATQTTDTSGGYGLQGMGVFGTALGIHGRDSLMVAGDLVLDHADVVGEGVLVLKSKQPKRLIARNSTLTNLAIDNPTRVTLQGDLRITGHLTIKAGTFATDEGTLMLTPTCQTKLLVGGQLKTGLIVRSALPVSRLAINLPLTGLLNPVAALPAPVIWIVRQGAVVQGSDCYASLAHKKNVPPPEVPAL